MGNTLNAADLHRALSDAKPFMSKDATVPAICAMRIECDNGNLVAVATDRFTLGASRVNYSGEVFTVTLTATNVDNLLRIAKTARRDADARTVEIEVPSWFRDGEANTIRFTFSTGESVTMQRADSEFPKWRQIISSDVIAAADPQPALVCYSAALLAKFAKVTGSEHMRVYSRGAKPTVVTIGTDFVGLIMPTRSSECDYTRPAWVW